MRRTIGGLRKSGNYGKTKEKIYSSPFEAEWAVLNHKRIFYDSEIHSGVFKRPS